jgi:hypothetical protein
VAARRLPRRSRIVAGINTSSRLAERVLLPARVRLGIPLNAIRHRSQMPCGRAVSHRLMVVSVDSKLAMRVEAMLDCLSRARADSTDPARAHRPRRAPIRRCAATLTRVRRPGQALPARLPLMTTADGRNLRRWRRAPQPNSRLAARRHLRAGKNEVRMGLPEVLLEVPKEGPMAARVHNST